MRAVNYVLKPVTENKMFFALDDIIDKMSFPKDDYLIVKSTEGIQKIILENLMYCEVVGRIVYYHLLSERVIACTELFSVVSEKLLKSPAFIKPHRSYVVNMSYINIITNSSIVLQNNFSIPVSRNNVKDIKNEYLDFQMGKW